MSLFSEEHVPTYKRKWRCTVHIVYPPPFVNLFSSSFEFKMAGYKVTSLLRCWGELPERWLYKPHPGGLPCTYRSIFEVVTSISKKFTSFIEKWPKGRGGPIKTSKNKWRKIKRNQCMIWRKIRRFKKHFWFPSLKSTHSPTLIQNLITNYCKIIKINVWRRKKRNSELLFSQ